MIAIDIRLLGKKRTGDEMVFFHLTKEVLKLDRENRYLLLTDETDTEKISALSLRLECAGQNNVEIVSLPSKNRFVWNLWTLPRYLFGHTVDLFHTQYILPLFSPRRTKIAVHIHDVSFCAYPELIGWSDRLFLSFFIPRSLRRAVLIIAPSQFTKNEIVKYYGISEAKIAVIPNAVGEDFLDTAPETTEENRLLREKYHLPERFIIYVGTLQPRKNIPFLIESFAKLSAHLRNAVPGVPDLKLVLVGNREAHHTDPRIDTAIATHRIADSVVFPGFIDQDDLPHVIRLADIFVFPSLYEGFGIPLLEAMSQGVPVAASDIPSLREVAGESALYFDPTSIANCEEKLYTLFIDQKEKDDLIQRGKARLHFFSWQKSADFLRHKYTNTLKNMNFNTAPSTAPENGLPKKRRWLRITLFFVVLLVIAGSAFAWKTGFVLNKISSGNANIFGSLLKSLPGVDKTLSGENEGRINILLLGMRGEGVEGGGLLADTIMVLSIHPKQDEQDTTRASLVSVPRDFYVKVPGQDWQAKINAVFAEGEKREPHKGGIDDMRTIVGEITGLNIPYAITINFQGFKDLVNALGGIRVTLDQPFEEALQFREPHVCDSYVFTIPTNPPQFEHKYYTRKDGTRYIAKSYPLCYNPNLECGGSFKLDAGENTLDGDKALCYARSRVTSNDFERAKRQQQVIQSIKDKALSAGTLTNFDAINGILDSLGDNVRTNFEAWEMKRLFELYQKIGTESKLTQKVLDTTEEGLLYHPENAAPEAGYILLPRGDTYDQIRELFRNSLNP